MSPIDRRIKRRVWIGLAGASAAVVVSIAWLRVQPAPASPAVKRASPFVQLARAGTAEGDALLREKAELMDPTPLFFPTDWNYGQRPLAAKSLRQPGQVFGSFEPLLPLSEKGIGLYGLEIVPVPEKLAELADVLVQGNEAPFAGIGHIDSPRSSLSVRAGFLEIRELKTENLITSQQLSGISPPRSDFAPVEFLVVVGSAGVIGEPILTRGSDWDEVDAFFRIYLVKSYRIGERLSPGQYRVVVGA